MDMKHIEHADSETLYQAFLEAFHNDEEIFQNLVGLSTDGANNMRGIHNSLNQKILLKNKGIYSIHCLCHIANLIAKRAQTALPEEVIMLVKTLYNYFSRSSFQNDEYLNLQKSLGLQPLRIPQPSPTRWTGISEAINIILERWSVLELFFHKKLESGNRLITQGELEDDIEIDQDIYNLFDEENFERAKPENKVSIEQKVYELLIDKEIKAYIQFLKCTLTKITCFIKVFEGNNFDCSQSYEVVFSFIKYFSQMLFRCLTFKIILKRSIKPTCSLKILFIHFHLLNLKKNLHYDLEIKFQLIDSQKARKLLFSNILILISKERL